MNVTFEKQDLMNAVNVVMKAVPNKSTMEILSCIAITAVDSKIVLAANNLELGIECEVEGRIEEGGSIAVNARFFAEVIRRLPENQVVLHTEEDFQVRVLCELVDLAMPYVSTQEFPVLPKVEEHEKIMISQYTFKELIRQTAFCIAENNTRVSMTGELLECNNQTMRLASLDGFRLAVRNTALRNQTRNCKVIIPGKTLMELSKILSDHYEDSLRISMTSKHILFQLGTAKVVSRLLEGEFYAIENLTALEYPSKVIIDRRGFLECLERTLLLINEAEKKPVVCSLNENLLRVSVSSINGRLQETMAAEQEGSRLKIAFNPRYLIDALRAIDSEKIEMYYNTGKTPCTIRDKESTYLYLISPVAYEE